MNDGGAAGHYEGHESDRAGEGYVWVPLEQCVDDPGEGDAQRGAQGVRKL
jgi:hypothetical protein